MLQINKSQFAEFEKHFQMKANLDLAEYTRQRFPDKFGSVKDDDLVPFIMKIRERAKLYGIRNENDIATAIDLSVMYEEDFYKTIWAKDIFSIKNWTGDKKMKILRKRIRLILPGF
jgi:hypothetical protein